MKSTDKFKIKFYSSSGILQSEEELLEKNLVHIHGMISKCTLKNGDILTGFAECYRLNYNFDNKVHNYIYLWNWDNIDEEKHELIGDNDNKYNQTFTKVNIDDIVLIESILYSNPRWGGRLTNKFEFYKSNESNNKKIDEVKIPPFLKNTSFDTK